MAIVVPKGSQGAYREQIVFDARSVVWFGVQGGLSRKSSAMSRFLTAGRMRWRALARLHPLGGVGATNALKSLGRESKGRHYRR
jgi:hypothetical protein